MTLPSDDHHWSRAPGHAPWAFWVGGLLGALWPFVLFYVVWLFRSGANLAVEGPTNWADVVLGYCMIASYGGCFTILLLAGEVILGFFVAGYLTAMTVDSLRHRRATAS